MNENQSAQGPLSGIRILDCSTAVSGAFAATLLGDMGAEVIKVEPHTGDQSRQWGPFYNGEGRMFQAWNRNKRSISVDLKTDDGLGIFEKLVATADVIIENFRVGITQRLRIDYETVRKTKPDIIYCSVTAYGDKGPYQQRPAYDPILQAMSGAAKGNETYVGNVGICSVAVADYSTALLVVAGVNAALFSRTQTGKGQHVKTSLMQGVMTVQSHSFLDIPDTEPEGVTGLFPNKIFQGQDGLIHLSAPTLKFWKILCAVLGAPELADDPRYQTTAGRSANADELTLEIEKCLAKRPLAEWIELLVAENVPCSPILSYDEFFDDPQVTAMNMNPVIHHDKIGRVRTIGVAVDFESTPGGIQFPAPVLGEHSAEILGELGYSDSEVQQLTDGKIVLQ
ncbi:MAG: CoA transferase [Candidatus Hydrogenedentota bacterium]